MVYIYLNGLIINYCNGFFYIYVNGLIINYCNGFIFYIYVNGFLERNVQTAAYYYNTFYDIDIYIIII
jgi:hypothetical protein